MIGYSLNQMGPWAMKWYIDRGLTIKKTIKFSDDFIIKEKAGTELVVDDITIPMACGRIDIRDGSPFGDEIGVPVMYLEDWAKFGAWLRKFKTNRKWPLERLVKEYEKTNPPIRWWKDEIGEN